jgi:hypothetical protein
MFDYFLQASFDQYMDDKLRVARAVFHDKTKTKQLNEVLCNELCV